MSNVNGRSATISAGIFLAIIVLLGSCDSDTRTPAGDALRAFEQYQGDARFPHFKAFAWDSETGGWGRAWGFYHPSDAIEFSYSECKRKKGNCSTYAVGDVIVFDRGDAFQKVAVENYYASLASIQDSKVVTGKQLTAEEILANLSDRTVIGKTFGGQKYIAELSKAGAISVRLLDIHADVRKHDTGRWWAKNNNETGLFCRQFTYFFGGKVSCHSVRFGSNVFELYNDDGKFVSQFYRKDGHAD